MSCTQRLLPCIVPAQSGPGSSSLHEPEAASQQGPIFISEPAAEIVYTNSQGVLVPCTAYGRPAPVLDWVHGSGPRAGQALDDVPGLLEIMPNNSLYIRPFGEVAYDVNVHAAKYRCTASNEAGTIVSREVTLKAGKEKVSLEYG